ncbi:MAG: homocysteine S-methyltransferase [Eubacteriales bacterium]|nr:homocysteine S-methyltransferase [Eubacteriales bacterium]
MSTYNTIQQIIEKNGIMVIDGSMSTALEHLGADLNSKLWTARALAESPDLVRQVHLDYFRAGADCGITCSYQATIPGLTANGYTQEEAERLIARSVEIFRVARQQWWEEEGKQAGRAWPLCLAGIGPYGAYLADGSEYRGRYGVSDEVLDRFHRRRMEILHEAGADILLIETQPSLHEALLAAGIAEEFGADYWISFSCMDEKHICEGDPIRACAKAFAKDHPHLQMIGVNCTKPAYIAGLVRELRAGLQDAAGDGGRMIPIGVYPNSGEEYDAVTKTWHGTGDARSFGEYAMDYMKAGADAVGGCCTTVASHVEQVVDARKQFVESGMHRKM